MTTAHRPTFDPAKGGTGKSEGALSSMSKQYSARDLPSHKTLKYRQEGQTTQDEVRNRDIRRELEERELAASSKSGHDYSSKRSSLASHSGPAKKSRHEVNLDADDPVDDDDDSELSSSEGEDDDDTEELMRELEKIKRERAIEAARQEAEKKAEEERIRTENIIRGNPLLNEAEKEKAEFKVRRRWDDDSVFKNCSRDGDSNKGFVNDMLRTEFHKRFMDKYIK